MDQEIKQTRFLQLSIFFCFFILTFFFTSSIFGQNISIEKKNLVNSPNRSHYGFNVISGNEKHILHYRDLIFYLYEDGYFQSTLVNSQRGSVDRQFLVDNDYIRAYHLGKNEPIGDIDNVYKSVRIPNNSNAQAPQLKTKERIMVSTSWNPTLDDDSWFILIASFRNIYNTISNGEVNINLNDLGFEIDLAWQPFNHINPDFAFIGSSFTENTTASINNNAITIQFQNLQKNQLRHVYFKVKRKPNEVIKNKYISISFDISMNNIIDIINNNTSTTASNSTPTSTLPTPPIKYPTLYIPVITNPHDPNYITVDKEILCPTCDTLHPLTYEVVFQNEGNGLAKDVEVKIVLDRNLLAFDDVSDFFNISSPSGHSFTSISPTLTRGINNKDTLHFKFEEIKLPGLKQTEYTYQETIGSIRFSVNTKTCLQEGKSIYASAVIVFHGYHNNYREDTPTDLISTKTTSNLLENGDFERGNKGFESDLNYSCESKDSSYCIGNTMADKFTHHSFPDIYDHTLGKPTGKYMIIDGSNTANTTIWSESTKVVVDQEYAYSFWCYVPSKINGYINKKPFFNMIIDENIVKVFDVRSVHYNAWRKYTVKWKAPQTKLIQLSIQQKNRGPVGYHYGIDDIFFSTCGDYEENPYIPITVGDSSNNVNNESVTVVIEEEKTMQVQLYPNPFKDQLTIIIQSPIQQIVIITLYDITGRKITTLFNDDINEFEKRNITFDGIDLKSGLYMVHVQTPVYQKTYKVFKQ